MWLLLLGIYALGTTGLVIALYRRKHGEDRVLAHFEAITASEASAVDQAKAAAELMKVRQGQIPWWERSLSAIGVIAFFSMLSATTVQTFRAGIEAANADRLKADVEELESRQADLRAALGDVTTALVSESRRGKRLTLHAKRLLRQRLDLLLDEEDLTSEERVEGFEIAFALDDYDTMLELYGEDITKLTEAVEGVPADVVSLAQFYYLEGASRTARELLDGLQDQLSTLPPDWRVRVAILRAALDPDREQRSAREIAAVLHISSDEAMRRLSQGLRQYRDALAHMRPARAESGSPDGSSPP